MYEPKPYDPCQPPPPEAVLPTMYDLPSEDPEAPGLPDEFHGFQPQLLQKTCQPGRYPALTLTFTMTLAIPNGISDQIGFWC